MAHCDYCGIKIDGLPFHCRRCGGNFCSSHRLPEDHNGPGLKRGNIFENLGSKKRQKSNKRKKRYHEVQEHHKKEYVGTSRQKPNYIERVKSFFKRRYYKTKSWLNSRHHRSYRNLNAFFMNILWIVVLSISFMIIYSNLEKLNEIVLWFLPLGGALLLVNAFFWIKYFWKFLKRIFYWYEGERNWVKYLILIILIVLLWQGYQTRDTLFDSAIEKYNQFEFERILPLNLNISWSDFNPENIEDLDTSEASTIQKILYTPPERKEECEEAFDYVNQVRKEKGRKPMKWDDNLYKLAVERSKDMVKRNYFDHVTPEGKCVNDFKAAYGFANYNVAENIGGMTHYDDGNPVPETSVKEAVDGWLDSRGHRYNLLYPSHTKGAIGCYKAICVFLGANQKYYGLGYGPCTTGEEGLAYWNTVGKQPGEI
jgi:uncharacterized protein YkwD